VLKPVNGNRRIAAPVTFLMSDVIEIAREMVASRKVEN